MALILKTYRCVISQVLDYRAGKGSPDSKRPIIIKRISVGLDRILGVPQTAGDIQKRVGFVFAPPAVVVSAIIPRVPTPSGVLGYVILLVSFGFCVPISLIFARDPQK